MAQFLTTKQALAEIESIIDRADKELTLLSPYQRIASNYMKRLRLAADRGVQITVVHGKNEMEPAQLSELTGLRGSRVLFQRELHAKCYFNERTMVITSLNLLQSSEQNWEMGVKLDAAEPAYGDAIAESERIIRSASPNAPAASVFATAAPTSGTCIRCAASIRLDANRPFCLGCFQQWDSYGNWDYMEKYCHACGRADETSRANPLCDFCGF